MPDYRRVGCSEEGVLECVDSVRNGKVVVYPTDTVYGIGCNPYMDVPVERVFSIKVRDEGKPLPVLVYNLAEAEKIVDLGRTGRRLAEKWWPGPVTIVAPVVDNSIAARVRAGGKMLGVRVPANECALSLLKHCKCIVGTSANISGQPSTRSADEVQRSGLDGFDILLDGGPVSAGRASTIVDIANLNIIREGAVSRNEIFDTLGLART